MARDSVYGACGSLSGGAAAAPADQLAAVRAGTQRAGVGEWAGWEERTGCGWLHSRLRDAEPAVGRATERGIDRDRAARGARARDQIGRASCRERVEILVGAVS